MKRLVIAARCLVLVLFVCSCGRTTCLDPGIQLVFRGYDSVDLSRVVIQQYEADDSFAHLVTVSILDTSDTVTFQSNDTIYMPHIDTGIFVAPGYDYVVSIPGVRSSFFGDSLFKITKISYSATNQKATSSGNGGCTNSTSYALDTIPHKVGVMSFTDADVPSVNIVLNK